MLVYMTWCLASQTTWKTKARWILEHQFPSRRCMETWYPVARGGILGLIAAHGGRSVRTAAQLPEIVVNWSASSVTCDATTNLGDDSHL